MLLKDEGISLQIAAQEHLVEGRFEDALAAAQDAEPLIQGAGDFEAEAMLQLLVAQAQLKLLELSGSDPGSWDFKQAAVKILEAGRKAGDLARKAQRLPLTGASLCLISQAQVLLLRGKEAVDAATFAAQAFRGASDRSGEANALLLAATGYLISGRLRKAKESASKALLLGRELQDEQLQARAEAALDAVDFPSDALLQQEEEEEAELATDLVAGEGGEAVQVTSADFLAIKEKVRGVVLEIVGMDDMGDDTPLMQSGLTSQSAVILRNSLGKELPGPSLPFTLMFDFPSISAMSEYFAQRSGAV